MLVLVSDKVLFNGSVSPKPGTIEVEDGIITNTSSEKRSESYYRDSQVDYRDYGDLIIMPGIVDAHVSYEWI